jgi:Transmembrane secretion effector
VPSPLRSPLVRRIVAAYTINRLGTWLGVVALSLAVYDRTHSAIAVAGLLMAAQVLPAIAVPAVVTRAEASKRGGELSGLYFVECATTVALAVLVTHFSYPAILLLVAVDGTAALAASALLRAEAARAGRGAVQAVSAEPPSEAQKQMGEQKVNAAINVAFSATFVAGPILGAALVAGSGAATALYLDAASFLICGAMLIDRHPHVEEAEGSTVAARLRAAWNYINERPALRALLLIQTAALVFFESAAPIEVAYAKTTLHAGDRGYGLLVTTWGLGAVVGSIIFARAGQRSLSSMISLGTLAVGLAYIGFAVSPTLVLACVAALLGGVGNGIQWAPLISAVQLLTPPNLHGRVMGALESLGAISPAVGLTLGGVLVALTSPRIAFLVVGIGAALATLAFMRVPIEPNAATDVGVAMSPDLPSVGDPAPH